MSNQATIAQQDDNPSEWTMTVTLPGGTTESYTGLRTLREMLLGVKKYMEEQKLNNLNKEKDESIT